MSAEFGQRASEAQLDAWFLTGPGSDLVVKTLKQMASIPAFVKLFGPYTPGKDEQRWADYQRMDWSIRQTPCIALFENQSEEKDTDNGFLNGTVTMQVFWPANLRRSDLARVPAAFKGIVENFFASDYAQKMLDELYYIERQEKVFGLNYYGKSLTWSPNAEGLVGTEMVPVTVLDIKYRIDLRAWYRAMEYMGRTRGKPFDVTLGDLDLMSGVYQGLEKKGGSVKVEVPDQFTVTNP